MEKRTIKFISVFLAVLLCALLAINSIYIVSADDADKIQKTYNWLQTKTVDKWSTLSVPQHVFSVLALNEKALLTTNKLNRSITSLMSKSMYNGSCWPSPSCDPINTSLAKLAIDNADFSLYNSEKANEWLANHTKPSREGINWFLQITQPPQTETICSIIYGENAPYELTISNTSEIQPNNLGDCLTVSVPRYWLNITDTEACLNQTYSIICSSDIKVNFLFKILQDNIEEWYVVGKTFSGGATETVLANITSNCIVPDLNTNTCDYESTLWAAYAYYSDGSVTTAKTFLPYLIMQKDKNNNQAYLPSAFLYYIISKENYANDITPLQLSTGLISSSTTHHSYYNTAIARRTNAAKNTNITKMNNKLILDLIREGVNYYWKDQSSSGNAIKDTAMLLWAVGREFSGSQISECEEQGLGLTCVDNCSGLGGTLFPEFSCLNNRECCNLSSTTYDCEQRQGNCKPTCYSNETQMSYSCAAGTICCKPNSLVSCVTELHGQICTGDQDCANNQSVIMPFANASEPRCCLYNCVSRGGGGQQQSCISLGGEVCDPALGKSCQTGNWLSAIEPNCCRLGFCTTTEMSCSQKGGIMCASGEGCKDGQLVIATDTNGQATCCIQGGRCIQQSCSGASCEDGEACYGGTMKETVDVLRCCEGGNCLKTCSGYGGNPCGSDLVCKGTNKPSSDFANCCVGTCEKKSFPWLIIIIIFVVALGIGAFFLLRKKGGSKKKDDSELMYGFPPSSSQEPSAVPSSYSPPVRPRPTSAPIAPKAPRVPTMPAAGPRQQPVKKRPTKAKTSRESDLDDTLEKLKKMGGE